MNTTRWFQKVGVALLVVTLALGVWGGLPAPKVAAATCTWTGAVDTAWENAANWSNCNGLAPQNNDTVIIPDVSNDPVINSAATTGLNVTIQSGGKLTNSSSGNIAFASFTIQDGGTYIHDRAASLPGSTRSFAATSTVEFLRNTTNTCPVSATYGNLIINISNFTQNVGCAGNLANIQGNLEIRNTNGYQLRLVSTQSTAHNIGGNLIISGGNLVLSSGTGAPTINVSGNVIINSGLLDLGTSSGAPQLIIAGHFEQSGGTLQRGGSGNRTISLAGNWTRTGGTFTSTGIEVVFNGTTEQTIGGSSATTFNNLTVAYGATVNLPSDATVSGTLINNGKLIQTQDVNGNTDVTFLGTGGYSGVVLNANNVDLGTTTVTILGNQACDTNDSSVHRCFEITPANASGRNATATFYFADSELNGEDCATMGVYRWTGSAWESLSVTSRQCTTSPYSVQTTITNFSKFALSSGGQPPTAITLSRLEAQKKGAGVGLLALSGLVLGGLSLLLRRRR